MANHKSAEKRVRQTARKTEAKARTRATVRTYEKKLRTALEKKDASEAQTLFLTYSSKMGKAAQKGIYHANTASRKIGRLARQVAQIAK